MTIIEKIESALHTLIYEKRFNKETTIYLGYNKCELLFKQLPMYGYSPEESKMFHGVPIIVVTGHPNYFRVV